MLGSKQDHLCEVMHEVIPRGQHRFPGCPCLLVLIIHLPLLPVGAASPEPRARRNVNPKNCILRGLKK